MDALEQLNRKLQKAINVSPLLKQYKDQLKIDFTRDGLRIQIVDALNRPMFPLGSGKLEPHAQKILAQITPLIAKLPNKITLIGHTDATPFSSPSQRLRELGASSDPANAARRAMVASGLRRSRAARLGSPRSPPSIPMVPAPRSTAHRRPRAERTPEKALLDRRFTRLNVNKTIRSIPMISLRPRRERKWSAPR